MESNTDPIDVVSESLKLNSINRSYLRSASGWGTFLAIIAFIFVGFMVIMALAMGTLLTALGGAFTEDLPFAPVLFSVFYLIIALVYFFPAWFLFRFSSKMKSALQGHSQVDLDSSFSNLRSLFRFMGILTLVVIFLYLVGILAGILFAENLASLVDEQAF